MVRGAWQARVHVVTKSQPRLKRLTMHAMVIQRSRENLELAQAEKIPKEDQESSKYKMPLVSATLFLLKSSLFGKSSYCPNSPPTPTLYKILPCLNLGHEHLCSYMRNGMCIPEGSNSIYHSASK